MEGKRGVLFPFPLPRLVQSCSKLHDSPGSMNSLRTKRYNLQHFVLHDDLRLCVPSLLQLLEKVCHHFCFEVSVFNLLIQVPSRHLFQSLLLKRFSFSHCILHVHSHHGFQLFRIPEMFVHVFQNFLIGYFLYSQVSFIPLCVEPLQSVTFESDLVTFIKSVRSQGLHRLLH